MFTCVNIYIYIYVTVNTYIYKSMYIYIYTHIIETLETPLYNIALETPFYVCCKKRCWISLPQRFKPVSNKKGPHSQETAARFSSLAGYGKLDTWQGTSASTAAYSSELPVDFPQKARS